MPPLAKAFLIEAARRADPSMREMVATLTTECAFYEASALGVLLDRGLRPAVSSEPAAWLTAPACWIERAVSDDYRRVALLLTTAELPIVDVSIIILRPLSKPQPTFQLALADLPGESREAFAERQGLPAAFPGEVMATLEWIASPPTPRRVHRPPLGLAGRLRRAGLLSAGNRLPPWTEIRTPSTACH